MAISYSRLFARCGKILKKINAANAEALTTLPADLLEIANEYEADDVVRTVSSIYSYYAGLQQAVIAKRQGLANFITSSLLDRDTVTAQLNLTNPSINDVLIALHQAFLDDAQTLERQTVSLGSVTAGTGNVGNGTIILTKLLDGVTPPLSGAPVTIRYAGLDSELAPPAETHTFAVQSAGTEGSESWNWKGGTQTVPFDYLTEGSGQGPGLQTANGSGRLTDGNFENWTSTNTPTNWPIVTSGGTAGTHIFRESGAGNFHRGTYSLKFLGTGAQAVIGVEQALSASSFTPRRCYNFSIRIKASGVPAAGAIDIKFTGTGYTASSTEKIAIAAGDFPTAAFTAAGSLQKFFIVMPATIPSDLKMVIQITGTLSNATAVYFDSAALQEVTYHGGIGAVGVAGSTALAVGDRFTAPVTCNATSVWQEMFRKQYKFQMPSVGGGSETVADSLAV